MSAVLPYTEQQSREWTHRDADGWEPIELVLPGWLVSSSRGLPNERSWHFGSPRSQIALSRYWGRPLSPGGPMSVASTRRVTTQDGRSFDVHLTHLFDGQPRVVEVTFLSGPGWNARIVFDECMPEVVDAALARLRLNTRGGKPNGAAPRTDVRVWTVRRKALAFACLTFGLAVVGAAACFAMR